MDATLQSVPLVGTRTQIELRRKIRKGTQSCWECKRRKVRCNLAVDANTTCDGCKRRKTKCVSQEFPTVATKPASIDQLHNRISHLEAIISRLAGDVGSSNRLRCSLNSTSSDHGIAQNEAELSSQTSQSSSDTSTNNCAQGNLTEVQTLSRLAPELTKLVQRSSLRWRVQGDSLTKLLVQAWPSPQNLEIILSLPDESLGLLHGIVCVPSSMVLGQTAPSLRDVMRLPLSGCHPVLIARKLLTLASHLQNLSPLSTQALELAGVDYRGMVHLAVKTVRDCVICNDELLDSIEGIECMMIESMYQNNAGNLRSAWHTVHRAISIAQMIDLHRGNKLPASKLLELETHNRIHPEYMWLRLIQMNRYLSMMLGLLQGSTCDNFAHDRVLERCSPVDRMQRLDCAAAGYILHRNETGLQETTIDTTIDELLRKSAASVPPSWWLMPNIASGIGNDMKTLQKIIRVMDQLTHYHLVIQLHLPHLVNSNTDYRLDYRKTIAADASRDILVRFTSLCTVHAFSSFCRGVSYLAFLACVVLCIVHLDAKLQRQTTTPDIAPIITPLLHQHPKDRGLMEVSLQSLRQLASSGKDPIASKLVGVVHQLLVIEADVTVWRTRVIGLTQGKAERGHECDGRPDDSGQMLEIFIPHIGAILFERDDERSSAPTGSFAPMDAPLSTQVNSICHIVPSQIECASRGQRLDDIEQLGRFELLDQAQGGDATGWPINSSSQGILQFNDEFQLHQSTSTIDSGNDFDESWFQQAESLCTGYAVPSQDWDAPNLDTNYSEVFF